jgi:hypothetical protein
MNFGIVIVKDKCRVIFQHYLILLNNNIPHIYQILQILLRLILLCYLIEIFSTGWLIMTLVTKHLSTEHNKIAKLLHKFMQ